MTGDSTERYQRGRGYILGVYLGMILVLLAGSWGLARVLDLQFDRVFLVVGGFLTLGGTWLRPWWFWEHPKARFVRRILGDSGAAVAYTIIGMGMVYLGFFTTFRITH
jgi:hypothetical protein